MNAKPKNSSNPTEHKPLTVSLQQMLDEMREVDRDLVNRSKRSAEERRERVAVRIAYLASGLGIFLAILVSTTGLTQLVEVLSPKKLEGWMPVVVTFVSVLVSFSSIVSFDRLALRFLTKEGQPIKEKIREREASLYKKLDSNLSELLGEQK